MLPAAWNPLRALTSPDPQHSGFSHVKRHSPSHRFLGVIHADAVRPGARALDPTNTHCDTVGGQPMGDGWSDGGGSPLRGGPSGTRRIAYPVPTTPKRKR